MGTKVGRVAIFGIPLRQEWSYDVDGDNAPSYCLNSDASLLLLLIHGCLYRDGLQVSVKGGTAAAGPYDYRLQSHGQRSRPPDQETYLRVYQQYGPLWKLLTNDASEKVRKGNY